MQTIGHHTCKKDGGKAYVEQHAPFLATNEDSFLGKGYYYWDDNLEMAKYWGQVHYFKNYFIVESHLNLPPESFLDLVGNRQHLRYFREIIEFYKEKGYEDKKWPMGKFIEYAKKLEKKEPGRFPFKAIRAIDNNPRYSSPVATYFFVKGKAAYTDLDPRLVICILEKNEVILQTKEVVFESERNKN